MRKRTFYYKRTIKRITKLVSDFIKENSDYLPLDWIWANPLTGAVAFDNSDMGDHVIGHPAMFFTMYDDSFRRVVDEKSIRHWVMVDLRRVFVSATTPVCIPSRSLRATSQPKTSIARPCPGRERPR